MPHALETLRVACNSLIELFRGSWNKDKMLAVEVKGKMHPKVGVPVVAIKDHKDLGVKPLKVDKARNRQAAAGKRRPLLQQLLGYKTKKGEDESKVEERAAKGVIMGMILPLEALVSHTINKGWVSLPPTQGAQAQW